MIGAEDEVMGGQNYGTGRMVANVAVAVAVAVVIVIAEFSVGPWTMLLAWCDTACTSS